MEMMGPIQNRQHSDINWQLARRGALRNKTVLVATTVPQLETKKLWMMINFIQGFLFVPIYHGVNSEHFTANLLLRFFKAP
ncbi:MAG: hypothetical protein H7A09_07335 [Oceanospirillaceae bacterium]|nr:hypothetical protein [Oceanospirillaceae bacterium]MCP5349812.1 hypothetical protein [Oceanospirillaceae bacterium]